MGRAYEPGLERHAQPAFFFLSTPRDWHGKRQALARETLSCSRSHLMQKKTKKIEKGVPVGAPGTARSCRTDPKNRTEQRDSIGDA